jgi:hypothetical protein
LCVLRVVGMENTRGRRKRREKKAEAVQSGEGEGTETHSSFVCLLVGPSFAAR